MLIIEVADSTLEYDRDEKIPRYAQMRIPKVWLVDVNDPAGDSIRASERGPLLSRYALSRRPGVGIG